MYVQINTKQADQFDFSIYTLNNINPIFLQGLNFDTTARTNTEHSKINCLTSNFKSCTNKVENKMKVLLNRHLCVYI